MKSPLFRNAIVTSVVAAVMACAMPLSAAAQDRDREREGRDGNDSRYYSQRDANCAPRPRRRLASGWQLAALIFSTHIFTGLRPAQVSTPSFTRQIRADRWRLGGGRGCNWRTGWRWQGRRY